MSGLATRSGVDGHEAWLVTDPALCDYARVGPFHDDSAWLGALTCTPESAHVPMIGHPFCQLLSCLSVSIQTLSPVLVCLSKVFHVASSACRRFLPHSLRDSYSRSGLAPHSFSTLFVGCLLVWWSAMA